MLFKKCVSVTPLYLMLCSCTHHRTMCLVTLGNILRSNLETVQDMMNVSTCILH